VSADDLGRSLAGTAFYFMHTILPSGLQNSETAGAVVGVARAGTRLRSGSVLNGLYLCTVREWKGLTGDGSVTLEAPTYTMRKRNFKRFVSAWENLSHQWRQVSLAISAVVTLNRLGKVAPQRGADPWQQFCRAHERLVKHYQQALSALIYEDRSQKAVFFNVEFYPRPAEDQRLFRQFIDAFLAVRDIKRLNLQGPKSGTRALTFEEQRLVESISRKRVKPEARSRRIIADEIWERNPRRGGAPGSKKRAATERAISRHLRRQK